MIVMVEIKGVAIAASVISLILHFFLQTFNFLKINICESDLENNYCIVNYIYLAF